MQPDGFNLSDMILALPKQHLILVTYVKTDPSSALDIADAVVPFHGAREEEAFWASPWKALVPWLETLQLPDEDAVSEDHDSAC